MLAFDNIQTDIYLGLVVRAPGRFSGGAGSGAGALYVVGNTDAGNVYYSVANNVDSKRFVHMLGFFIYIFCISKGFMVKRGNENSVLYT